MTQTSQTASPYVMRKIKLDVARSKDHVGGSGAEGYEFIAPLDPSGHISVEGWKAERALCFVHRLDHGAIVEKGLLVHKAGGEGGGTWAFDYVANDDEDDDLGYRFSSRVFAPGEYVSLREHDGVTRTYRVTSVSPA